MEKAQPGAAETVKLSIAVGQSRHSTKWKNTELTWTELVERLSRTTRTPETLTEYLNMSKARQSDVKDIGGFVGGVLKGGRRLNRSVAWRQVGTLDMDFAPEDFAEAIEKVLAGCAYVIYGTHKNSPESPRVRIVLPMSRPVKPDEYQAVMRRIAADIGIEYFDDASYVPAQLMYWPSTPQDVDYYFKACKGDWINPDDILARYEDWTDLSQWPTSQREAQALRKKAAKQQDPYEKKGLIGAFCRTYGIAAAMQKFLPGVYLPCEGFSDRYTYAEGSTAAGAIVYEDKYLFSHHGTDPCSGQLVNAFDMVRLHRFSEMDYDVNPDTPTGRRPSYLAMLDLAQEDGEVKKTLMTEKLNEAKADFEVIEDGVDWMTKAKVARSGAMKKLAWNVKLILSHDEGLAGKLTLDLFSHRVLLKGDLPWRKLEESPYWTNDDDSCLRNYLSDKYDIDGRGIIDDALSEILVRNSCHVVRDYLAGLPAWDKVPRLDTLIIDYLGAVDTQLTRDMTRKCVVAAVTRVMEPGCKFDYVLTLVGKQGLGKSYIWKRLGHGWTSDSVSTVSGKEAMEQIQGAWIIELAELAALRKAELEAVKQFITKQDDSFRPAYGREVEHYRRQCIFVATTNEPNFIRDTTGGRRWWPIRVGVLPRKRSPFTELPDSVVEQIWAEALVYYTLDEDLFLDAEREEEVRKLQQEHTEESPWAGLVREYVDRLLPTNWNSFDIEARRRYIGGDPDGFDQPEGVEVRDRVCALEVWVEALGGAPKAMTRLQSMEINGILRNLEGWEPIGEVSRFGVYGRQRGYKRCSQSMST